MSLALFISIKMAAIQRESLMSLTLIVKYAFAIELHCFISISHILKRHKHVKLTWTGLSV